MRTRKKMGSGRSVKVRDLPEDGARTATIITVEELVFNRCKGKPLASDKPVEFRGQNNPGAYSRLAALEARVMDHHRRGYGHGHRN